jgi:hypothetical protein
MARTSATLRGTDALIDAFAYPLRGGAVATQAAYLGARLLAAFLPFAPVVQFLLTLGYYKYAFECLGASAQGRREPPEVLATHDEGTHRRHLLIQLLWMFALAIATHLLPFERALVLLLALALALPGALIALSVAQNLVAALDPRSWWIVATRLGPGYLILAGASFGLFTLQVLGREWLQPPASGLLAWLALQALVQYLLLALFRAFGTALHAHARALEFDPDDTRMPVIERDREQAALAREQAAALELADPAARAAALAGLLRDAKDESLHRAYRTALRASGQREALVRHAGTHACELVALGHMRTALALTNEALQDDPVFTLPDAGALAALVAAGERMGMARQTTALAANYVRRHPRRYDGLELGLGAAIACADRLGEADRARTLLMQAAELAGDGPEADRIQRLRQRLDAGIPLGGGPAAN